MIHRLIRADEVETDQHHIDVEQLGDGGDAPAPSDLHTAVPAPPPGESSKAGLVRVTRESEDYGETIGEPTALPTERLCIREVELKFMYTVAPLMPRTPRSLKRFVNIYRLYKAALAPRGLANFLGTPEHPGNFRAVQVLLALVIGTPDLAKAVVEELARLDESSPKRLSDLGELLGPPQPTWKTTLEALANFAKVDDNNLALNSLREVSALVTRYSLHHMVSTLPGESALE